MQIDATYKVTRIDSEGNDWFMGSCKTQEELQCIINLAKALKPLQDVTIEITKTTVITVFENIDNFIVKAVAPTVDSVIVETIGQSEGTRDFYYPESFQYLTPEQQGIVLDSVSEALDYCDHCGHLQDAPSLNMDEDTGASLCDRCYDDELQAREDEEDD